MRDKMDIDEGIKVEVVDYFRLREEENSTKRVETKPIKIVASPRSSMKRITVWLQKIRQRRRSLESTLRRRAKKILFRNLDNEYYRFLGIVGQQIRANNQDLYLKLKKYFPDRN